MKKLLSLVLALTLCLSLASFAQAESSDVYRYDENITLKVSVFDRGVTGNTPADDNAYTDWIQENFGDPRNITIEWGRHTALRRGVQAEHTDGLRRSG